MHDAQCCPAWQLCVRFWLLFVANYNHCNRSNVTGRHRGLKRKLPEGRKQKLRAPYSRRAMCRHSCIFAYWTFPVSVTSKSYFSLLSAVSRKLSALCVYSKFGHHPHPLGYLSTTFHFCRFLHCWASPRRKIAYSITHSPSLLGVPGTEAFRKAHHNYCYYYNESCKISGVLKYRSFDFKVYFYQRTWHKRY